MAVVDTWTGTHVKALREALRLSQREFAQRLGVAIRTVAAWDAGRDQIVPKPSSQEILDATLRMLSAEEQSRFEKLLVPTSSSAGHAERTSNDRMAHVMSVLGGETDYLPPFEVIEKIRSELMSLKRQVVLVCGEAGTGKSRLALHLGNFLSPNADTQWHDARDLVWSSSSLAEAILQFAGVGPRERENPLVQLHAESARLQRPLVVVIDGVDNTNREHMLSCVDLLLRHVSHGIRFVLMMRHRGSLAPIALSRYPLLSAMAETVELEAWSAAATRRMWNQHGRGSILDLPVPVRELARIPLYFHLLAGTDEQRCGTTFGVLSELITPDGLETYAVDQLGEAVPNTIPRPATSDRENPNQFLISSGGQPRLHPLIAEHVAAAYISECFGRWGRTALALKTLTELAHSYEVAGTGLFRQVIEALESDGLLVPLVSSPLLDVSVVQQVATISMSPDTLWSCAQRCTDSSHGDLARTIMESSIVGQALPSLVEWVLSMVETVGDSIGEAASRCIERHARADDTVAWLRTIDTAKLRQTTWTAVNLHLLTRDHHAVIDELVTHQHWQVRAGVAKACLSADTAWNRAALNVLVSDNDFRVRAVAADAACRGTPGMFIDQLLSDDNWLVRSAALTAISQSNNRELLLQVGQQILERPEWANCPPHTRAAVEQVLLQADPNTYASACPDQVWRLLRQHVTGHRRLAEHTERLLRTAATGHHSWAVNREADITATFDGIPVNAPCRPEAWRRLRGQRRMQVAISTTGLTDATNTAHAVVNMGIDLLEIREPLTTTHGQQAITRLKQCVQNRASLVANIVPVDTGHDQIEVAARAGADAVQLAITPGAMHLPEMCRTAHSYGLAVIVSVPLGVDVTWIREIERAGADGLNVATNDVENVATEGRRLRRETRLPVGVVGDTTPSANLAGEWDILIVGDAITSAVDIGRAVREFTTMALNGTDTTVLPDDESQRTNVGAHGNLRYS